MKTIRGCIFNECSGKVREKFRELGHDVWSCDLKPAEDGSPFHIQGDMRDHMQDGWNFAGMHPDCTYLNVAGIHWNDRGRGWEKTEQAVDFFDWCLRRELPYYIENPVGIISTRIRPPDQYVQPYQFGDDASKKTGLWLNGLPKLTVNPAQYVAPRWVNGKPRWANQTDSGQNKLAPSPTRAADRARTYDGIARAMAAQWSAWLTRA